MKKKYLFPILAAVFIGSTLGADYLILKTTAAKNATNAQYANLPIYSKTKLAMYDGTNPDQLTLLAMDGLIYDVSAGRDEFYAPGKPYHDLAGRDSSALLHIAGGNIIKNKYKVVGRLGL